MKYIIINNFKFDPLGATPSIPASLRYDTVPRDRSLYYIVQFNGPVTPAMKSLLASTGVTILQYIPYNAFVVRGDGPAMDRAATLPVVRWTGVFEPAYKLSPRLSDDYEAMLQRLADTQLNSAQTPDAVTVIGAGGGTPSKSIDVKGGAATSATNPSASIDPRAGALGSGALTSAQAGATSSSATSLSPSLGTAAGSLSGAAGTALASAAASRVGTSSRITVEITAFEKSRVPDIAQAASVLGGTQIIYSWGQSGSVRVELDKAQIDRLARITGAMYIDRWVQPTVMNDLARWVIQSGNTDTFATPVHDHGIFGTGQLVTLGDTGLDYGHPDFSDPNHTTPGTDHRKVKDYYSPPCPPGGCNDHDDGINHGTHTSGSIAGDDGVWHVYNGDATGSNGSAGPHDGQAFDAFIEMQDLSADGNSINFNSVTDLWSMAKDRDSWIHSNSWGSCCNQYIQESADTDQFIFTNQEFIVVFAAGNAGAGGLHTMNPFAESKNVIAAGATVNGLGLENVASFSSRGPSADGRIKPDVMAPGVSVWSAQGADPGGDGTTYWQLSGTSMATPTTAGAAALVREYYMNGWYPTGSPQPANGFTPSAALVKATLINSAREMTGTGAYAFGETRYPNDDQGFGRVTLDDALFFQGDGRGLTLVDERTGLNTGGSATYSLAIGDTSQSVEITLVWSDYPGIAGCSVCLVNDLDLTVTAPDGTVYKGNQYTGYNPGESQPNPAGRDSLNNVESVLVLSNVAAGLWTVRIDGVNVPQGPQSYALVMTGGVATEHGTITLDHDQYQSSATVNIQVVDTGLNTNPNAPDTVDVNMSSTTETTPEVVTLTETGPSTSVFVGSIPLGTGPPSPDGILEVTNGDNITAMYYDNNDGLGGHGPTYDYAVVDDTPPIISGIAATNLRFNRATIVWTTDELSNSTLHWGLTTPPLNVVSSARFVTSHALTISGLTENTTYNYSVQSTDLAGNLAVDDNNSAFYQFTTPLRPPTAPVSPDWPQFHNNPPRQGISPSNFAPPLNLKWSDGPFLINRWNGPVLGDGMLFSAPLDGTLRARDPSTGQVLWSRHLGDQYYYTGTDVVDNGVLYATFYGGAGGFVYALDDATGNTIWRVGLADAGLDFNARVMMGFQDNLLFGSAWGGEIYALNALDGSVAWKYQTGSLPFGGPSISAGMVYMATTGGALFALDEFSGALVWSTTLDGIATSSPLLANGVVYEGTYGGTMFALDAFSGNVIWSTGGFGLIDVSTPAFDGTAIYFGDFNSEYVSLDASTGTVLWRTSIGGPVGTSGALANGFLYGTSWDSNLYVFDTADGHIVESHLLNAFGSTSFPAVSDGWVWLEDNNGNIYGFFGQVPVGLQLSPPRARVETTPDSQVDYTLTVTNIGVSGPDTFDATVTLGSHGWALDLFEADGVTPLPDTNGNGIPDTGPLSTGASATVIARATVPATISPGDADTAVVRFTSSNDVTRFKHSDLTTVVPAPGVAVGPRAYFTPNPGDTVTATMQVHNLGGFSDTIDMTAASDLGWAVRFYQADGVTPLPDTNGNSIPDTGVVTGLQSATIVVQVDVPLGIPEETLQRATITGTSSLDTSVSGKSSVVVERIPPPDIEWPTFHNNQRRLGVSPSKFQPPLAQNWTEGPHLLQLWNGPVLADGIVYSAPLDGVLRARDPFTGEVLWSRQLGGQYFYTGTPTIANGVLYATFYDSTGGSVYALDALTGATIWVDGPGNTSLDFNARVSMAYRDGMVFGSAWGNFVNGQVYALDASNGSVIWSTDATGLPFGGAAVRGGLVYQGTTAGWVYAFNETTGAVVWSVMLDNTVTSVPLIALGSVFVGTYSGTMYALDSLSGAILWSTGGFNLIDISTPAFDGTAIYFGDYNAEYVSLDAATGAVLWRTSIGGPVGSSAALAHGHLYATTWGGSLYVFDTATGSVVDQHYLQTASTSSPAVSDGWVWLEDLNGNMYAFLGQLPVALTVSPGRQSQQTTPDSTVDYTVTVTNIGVSGPDTFDATVALGTHGWATALFKSDGSTPLPDTNNNGIPDTGPLNTGSSVRVVVRVTVPASVNPGDADTAIVTFTSSNDVTRFKHTQATTIVPPPGVAVGPRAYFTPNAGDTVSATMQVRNKGGFPDTIDVTSASDLGWTVRLFQADGSTPLADTNGNGIPDTGVVTGLQSATIVVQVDVPAGTPQDTLQRTTVTGTSSRDITASGTGTIVIELIPPPATQWPTFHNNLRRHGESASQFTPPITEIWRSQPQVEQLWSGPVLSDNILYSTTLDGLIRARDPFTGNVLWSRQLGDTYFFTDTPTVANGVVYTTFYGFSGGTVYALDGSTGATLWSANLQSTGLDFNARVAMAYRDGMVFGTAWGDYINGQLYALNASDGSKVWVTNMVGIPYGGAAVSGGLVYQGTAAGTVAALDEFTGAVVWSVQLDSTVTSPPLIAQGNLFVGTYAGSMYALDAQTGDQIWKSTGFSLIDFSTPAYDGTALYFGDFNSEFVALDIGTGNVLWRTPTYSAVGSSPAIANGYVYGTSWDGNLWVLRASDGQVAQTIGLGTASTSMPAISRGWVWLEDLSGTVHGFGAAGVGVLAGLTMTPETVDLTVGTATVIQAVGEDRYGNPVPAGAVGWSAENGLGSILPISDTTAIYVAGVTSGTDVVQANVAGFMGNTTVNVLPGALDRVVVTPGTLSIVAGTLQTFSASATDRFGNAIPSATFTWAVTGGIGTITSAGGFTAATRVGLGTVTATTGGKTGTALIQIVSGPASQIAVSPASPSATAGSPITLVASVSDAYGNPVSSGTVTWSASGGNVLVLTTDGRLVQYQPPTSTTPATQTVTATLGGASKAVTVSIVPGAVASIVISGSATVTAGASADFTATVTDQFGNVITGATIAWTSTGGTMDPTTGHLTAPSQAGSIVVTASTAGRQALFAVEVTAGALDHLILSTTTVSVATGSGTLLSVSGVDTNGNEVPGVTYTWTTTIGTVSSTAGGRVASFFAGDSGGTGTITVTGGGKSSTVSVTITESSLPFMRQATSTTSLVLLVVAILAIAVAVVAVVRGRSVRRDLEEMRKAGPPPPPL